MSEYRSYPVWDALTRWFHWINALCVSGLLIVGILILNANALGASPEGRILLKTVHVLIGYVFVVNLAVRLVWAFIGPPHARWRAFLPVGPGYLASLKGYISGFMAGRPMQYIGHNPAGRIGVTLLLLLLVVQAVTGLVLAGTDIFYPPLGGWIRDWIAPAGVDPATLLPGVREMYDAEAYQAMRAFRAPFIEIHEINFMVIAGVALVHIVSVIVTEIREGGGLISAMFTGKKILSHKPEDE